MMTLADTDALYNVPRLVPVSSPPYVRVLRWPYGHRHDDVNKHTFTVFDQ